jgi:AraC family transcriptional regulator, transcriptional activator of the genes for pyochelin and ferripyochelin receptors
MPIILTEQDFEQLLQAESVSAQAEASCSNCTAAYLKIPQQIGQGSLYSVSLQSGITFALLEGQFWQSVILDHTHPERSPLISKFYLSGRSRVRSPNVTDIETDYIEQHFHQYLYYLPGIHEYEEWQAEEPFQVVMLYVPPEFLQSFAGESESLPSLLNLLAQKQLNNRFHQPLGKITNSVQTILHQLLSCPYQGALQLLYLESKSLELLTLQWSHWAELETVPPKLRSQDLDRIHAARDILIEATLQPPSLTELARQVGLNDRKLKEGFRACFGTTVFGYLHQHRMEQAQQLLRERSLSVTEVAHQVGYVSASRFCDAFKRKFGVTPKAYQLGRLS